MSALHYLPNALSIARIALGLAFPFLPTDWRLWAVVAAALSDLFDGLAARWLRAESNAGRLLDPMADKVFVFALAGALIYEGALHPLWAVGLAARDITVLIGLMYVIARRQWTRGRKLRPSFVGKAATAVQFAVLLVLVAWGAAPWWLLGGAVGLSAVAAWDYARTFARLDSSPPAVS